MRRRLMIIVAGLVIVGLAIVVAGTLMRRDADAAATVYSSPINGGCYIAAPNQCRLHVDPFTININTAAGAKLAEFRLQANGQTIYHFRTDISNPPNYNYTPSLVALDFAANCGQTYVLNILGRDSLDANLLNMGLTAAFTCPAAVP